MIVTDAMVERIADSIGVLVRDWMTGTKPLEGRGLEHVIKGRLARLLNDGDAPAPEAVAFWHVGKWGNGTSLPGESNIFCDAWETAIATDLPTEVASAIVEAHNASLPTPAPVGQLVEAVPDVERIEMVSYENGYPEDADPIWRLCIGGYCADFETETAAQNFRAAIATLAGRAVGDGWRSQALDDVAAERRRQVDQEGWTAGHDDQHDKGEMAYAAACYALISANRNDNRPYGDKEASRLWWRVGLATKRFWPWGWGYWKPNNARRDLVKAGALILAEIERLDRLPASPTGRE